MILRMELPLHDCCRLNGVRARKFRRILCELRAGNILQPDFMAVWRELLVMGYRPAPGGDRRTNA